MYWSRGVPWLSSKQSLQITEVIEPCFTKPKRVVSSLDMCEWEQLAELNHSLNRSLPTQVCNLIPFYCPPDLSAGFAV